MVPIRDKQNTTTSILLVNNGVCATSQAVTFLFREIKSKECTLWGTVAASLASPHPKSAIIYCFGL